MIEIISGLVMTALFFLLLLLHVFSISYKVFYFEERVSPSGVHERSKCQLQVIRLA